MSATPETIGNETNKQEAPKGPPVVVVSNGEGTKEVNGKEFKYFFKTEKVLDNDGKEVGKGKKHPDVTAVLPSPTVEDVINALAQEGKIRDFVMDTINDAIFLAGRSQINEFRENNPDKEFKSTDFDLNKLTLEAIANMPKGQRGAWAPSEEDFKDFVEDYLNVLVHKIGYDEKKAKVHTDHFKNGFAKAKTNKPVIGKLKEFLTAYGSQTEAMEDNAKTYEWLVNRADKYLKAEEKNLLEAL